MDFNPLEEIVDGQSRIMPPATLGHHALIEALAEMLRRRLEPAKFRISATGAGLGIRRGGYKGLLYRIPDLMVLSREALDRAKQERDPRDPYVWIAPEFIAECLSPANRKGPLDRLIADYAERGAREVWLIDPEAQVRNVRQLILGSNARLDECAQASGGVLKQIALPNVSIDIDQLWPAFDRGL